jgi:hypothetical protein
MLLYPEVQQALKGVFLKAADLYSRDKLSAMSSSESATGVT